MHIGVFCPSYGSVGGIETIATSLIREFRAAGHEVTILARMLPEASATLEDGDILRLPFHQLPRRARHLARQLRFVREFRDAMTALGAAIRQRRVDAVLSLAISTYAPYLSHLARDLPVVVSLQGGEAGAGLTSRPRALRRALVAASRVVACATTLATQARALEPTLSSSLMVIPNGVDPGRFAAAEPFRNPRPYVLAAGRLVRQKGFDVLLDAFARVAPDSANVDLLLAGDGPERPALEDQRMRLGLGDRVQFLGAVDHDRIASLYRGALVVVCPSRWEGLPLVCLETMASGRALVATSVDGIPDAVRDGETGVLVPPDRPEALADALTSLLSDVDARARLGAAAQRAVQERFAWPSVARQYLAVLEAALAERDRRGDQTRS